MARRLSSKLYDLQRRMSTPGRAKAVVPY